MVLGSRPRTSHVVLSATAVYPSSKPPGAEYQRMVGMFMEVIFGLIVVMVMPVIMIVIVFLGIHAMHMHI